MVQLLGGDVDVVDARLRESGARAIGVILDLGTSARYQVRVSGLENYTRSPSSLVVFNHRRDGDTPIIGNALFGDRGLVAESVLPVFIAREDLFRRGFLADYLARWPAPARGLLSYLSLRPFLWALKAYPMRRIDERTLGEVLEDVLCIFGDLPLEQVLKAEWVERFEMLAAPAGRPLRVRHALESRFQSLLSLRYGLTKLTRSRFRALKPYERATIEAQLQLFVDLLECGETLQLAPEGAVSKDGRFARIRYGLQVLLNRPRVPVRVLPVGIIYDFMTSGRPWVFVNVGREMSDLKGLKPSETFARVAEAILAQSTITASQLASQLLVATASRHVGTVTMRQILDYVAREADRWARSGFHVDPRLLQAEKRERRLAECVEYCLHSGQLIQRRGGGYWVSGWAEAPPAGYADPRGAIKYCTNELLSLTALPNRREEQGRTII